MAIKLDMEKAYDKIEWNFLLAILRKLGFCDKWISLIRNCLSTVSYSIIINGTPEEHIVPSRGLRQDDPLSPYLFIIGAECLIRNLCKWSNDKKSDLGIKFSSGSLVVSNLMFADDCIIFAQATQKASRNIKELLDKYCSILGQVVNYHKSCIFFSHNIDNCLRQSISGNLQILASNQLNKYLGCPIIHNRVRKNTFEEVINKMVSKLAGWKANLLS